MDVNLGRIAVSLVARPGSAPSGAHEALQVSSLALDQALQAVSFNFDPPAYIPSGFEFRDAAHVSGARELLILTYVRQAPSSGGSFTLVYAPVTQYRSSDGGGRYLVVGDILSQTMVGAHAAALVSTEARAGGPQALALVWENGDFLQHLMGLNLAGGDLRRIAESVPAMP